MRKPKLLIAFLALAASVSAYAQGSNSAAGNGTANRYELAERFAGSKLGNMLFSTTVDPHWFKSGDKFWYS